MLPFDQQIYLFPLCVHTRVLRYVCVSKCACVHVGMCMYVCVRRMGSKEGKEHQVDHAISFWAPNKWVRVLGVVTGPSLMFILPLE